MDRFLRKGKRRNSKETCDSSSTDSDSTKNSTKLKKRTKIWEYFKGSHSNDNKYEKCGKCGLKKCKYKTSGNESNLLDQPNIKYNGTDSAIDASYNMNSIDSHQTSVPLNDINSQRNNLIDRSLAEMIAIDLLPYSIVENNGFLNFSKVLDCGYKLPSRAYLNELMTNLFNETSTKLMAILEKVSNVSVTCDLWKFRDDISYLTVKCHFVHDYSLRRATLETRKLIDPSAQNIAKTLREVLSFWSLLGKTVCIVTDNASSMVKACELLMIRNLPCFAHTLNLVVQDGLKTYDGLVEKCKTIVKFFTNEKLKISPKDFSHSLLQETPMRWNSFYFMIKGILETQEEIAEVLLSTTYSPLPFSSEEICVLRDLEQILALFQQASDKVFEGKYVTVSLIIPLTYGLIHKIQLISPKLLTSLGQEIATVFLESITRRLSGYEKRPLTRMATILDPRFKKLGFQQNTNAEQAEICFESELVTISNNECPVSENLDDIPISWDSFFDFLDRGTRSNPINLKREYLESAIVPQEIDPLLWIKLSQLDFPTIKTLMLKYFCIPATSVESESAFSRAGQSVSDRRTLLKEENINILLFLNQNLWVNSSSGRNDDA